MEKERETHESYGMISISRYTGRSQFFGSDLVHNNGISLTISRGDKKRDLSKEWYGSNNDIIKIRMSNSQFVDAITSGMDTNGVPCTIERLNGLQVPQIDHINNKKDIFRNEMVETHSQYKKRIDDIINMLDGNIGKRKQEEIKHALNVLRSHISSNDNFVMKSFNEAMEKTITEAKHSVSNYIDHKIHSLGVEGLRNSLQISIEPTKLEE